MAAPKGRTNGRKRGSDSAPDPGGAGVQPGTRTITRWSFDLLRAAEIQAETGQLRQAASLCDWILADERVKGALNTRIQALLGLDPSFEKSGDKRRSKTVVNALEASEDFWVSYPEPDLALMMAWGIMLGVAPMRHRWLTVEGHGGRWLPCPEFWHPQHVRFDEYSREWKVRVQAGAGLGAVTEETAAPGDGEWMFHMPYGTTRPYMLGAWRGLSRWVLVKYLAASDLANAGAKGSLLAATHEKQTTQPTEGGRSTEQQRARLGQDIYERGRDGVVVLPPGFDLKLIQAVANSESIYTAQIDLANTAIAIALRGGNLTTEVQGGSRAATEVQERLGDGGNLRWDGECLSTTLHDQSLWWWAKYNFGFGTLAPWPVYPTKPRRNHKERADAIRGATDAAEALLSLGFEIEAQAFIDEWELNGWVKAKPGQKFLAIPAANPAGPPPGKGMPPPPAPPPAAPSGETPLAPGAPAQP